MFLVSRDPAVGDERRPRARRSGGRAFDPVGLWRPLAMPRDVGDVVEHLLLRSLDGDRPRRCEPVGHDYIPGIGRYSSTSIAAPGACRCGWSSSSPETASPESASSTENPPIGVPLWALPPRVREL